MMRARRMFPKSMATIDRMLKVAKGERQRTKIVSEYPPAELIWLEAKQVLRGYPSMFKELTPSLAKRIRSAGLEEFKRVYEKILEEGPDEGEGRC